MSIVEKGVEVTKHAILRTISVICVLFVCAGIYYAVYRTFIKPRPTESYAQVIQAGGTNYNIEIYNPEDTFFLGIKLWGLKLGISKPIIKKINDITKEIKKIDNAPVP
jgi:hypothetical protein